LSPFSATVVAVIAAENGVIVANLPVWMRFKYSKMSIVASVSNRIEK